MRQQVFLGLHSVAEFALDPARVETAAKNEVGANRFENRLIAPVTVARDSPGKAVALAQGGTGTLAFSVSGLGGFLDLFGILFPPPPTADDDGYNDCYAGNRQRH